MSELEKQVAFAICSDVNADQDHCKPKVRTWCDNCSIYLPSRHTRQDQDEGKANQ